MATPTPDRKVTMPRRAIGTDRSAEDLERLDAIVASVRRTYHTVEDMTQSFIREAIVTGVFPPGQRLNLDAIAATLGVSRMPVRAGLRQLESEGLIQVSPYRGARVSVLAPAEIAEIYELRVVLECYLLEHLMAKLDDAFVDELEEIVGRLEAAEELGARLEQRQSFYQALYERAERPRALAQVNTLRSSVGRYLLLVRVDEHRGHAEFLGFLRARDLAGAQAWLTAHLRNVSSTLQGLVAQEENAGGPARDKVAEPARV
jgi:DNA-binding GntR family transcriptional regulator